MTNNNVSIIKEADCYGCGACATVCKAKGVELIIDGNGYYKRKTIDKNCTLCGKCLQICPVKSQPQVINGPKSYICYSKKLTDVINSTSGGFAYTLSKFFLKQGYIIIGASWVDDARRVKHILVHNENELELLRKSKYVQSYTVDAYKQLETIDKALIIGTPCQIAGLRNCCRNKKDYVFVDFDCMGPAGYLLWNKYYAYLTEKNPSGIKNLAMRTKRKSWMRYGTEVRYHNGDMYFGDKFKDPFCTLYHFAHMIQETCMDCKYLNASNADIRIGDAWDYTNQFKRQEIKNGLSVVTPITKQGKDIWSEIAKQFVVKEAKRLSAKPIASRTDEKLWKALQNKDAGIDCICRLYENIPLIEKAYKKLSILLSKNDSLYFFLKHYIHR